MTINYCFIINYKVLTKRHILLFVIFSFLVVIAFLLDLLVGSADLTMYSVLDKLFTGSDNTTVSLIVFDFRLPKALSAILIGAGLSVSGVLMQSLFRNPLAGPYVLGVSSGASLAVAIYVMIGGMGVILIASSSWILALAAIVGSFLVLLLVLLVAVRVRDSVSLLIIGIMIAGITSSVVGVIQFFTSPDLLQHFMVWTFGSLSDISYNQLAVLFPVVLLGTIAAFMMQKSLNTMLLGDNYVNVLGISLKKLRFGIIAITGLVAGTITAFAGPIVFIGVAVPHLARSVFDTGDHRILIPATVFMGATLMLLCDIASQLPGFSTSLPINSVTSLVGAPVIIWIILKNRSLRTSNF